MWIGYMYVIVGFMVDYKAAVGKRVVPFSCLFFPCVAVGDLEDLVGEFDLQAGPGFEP